MEVFRYFNEAKWADLFCMGSIRVGTLEQYRKDEHPERGDRTEGVRTYHSGTAIGSSDDPRVRTIASRSGIGFGPGVRVDEMVIIGNVRRTRLDAFVLCCSYEQSPRLSAEFGPFCVRIKDAARFHDAVSRALLAVSRRGEHGRVLYRDVDYRELEEVPGPLGFVKNPRYDWQREYRFLWRPLDQRNVNSTTLLVPRVPRLCERVA